MRLPSRRSLRMWQRNRDVFFRLWKSIAPGFMIEPIMLLIALGYGFGSFMGILDGQEYVEYIVPGLVGSYAMTTATFECSYGVYFRMEYRRTYDSILTTPLNVEDIIGGEILWGATRSLITAVIILIVAAMFQLIPSFWVLMVPLVAVIEGIMFASITIVFTSLVPSVYSFNYFFTLFIAPITFLSGAFFPLDSLPDIVGTIGSIMPLTPAVEVIRSLVNGQFETGFLTSIGYLLLLAVAFFWLAVVTMRRRIIE